MRDIAALTDQGKVRDHNEDTVAADPTRGIAVVADGVGGHQRGEVASQIVCATILEGLATDGDLTDVVEQAHQQVLTRIANTGERALVRAGMGSTVVTVRLEDDNHYDVAWVGDSRAYLWDPTYGELTQISRDHSVVEELIAKGAITAEQARHHPERNVITQSLGVSDDMQLEVGRVADVLEPNQQLLLCSDGLTDELNDSQIAQVMSASSSPHEQSQALLQQVLDGAAKDNVSVVIVGPQQDELADGHRSIGSLLNVVAFVIAIAAFVAALWLIF